jgi:hypothetical protein
LSTQNFIRTAVQLALAEVSLAVPLHRCLHSLQAVHAAVQDSQLGMDQMHLHAMLS